MKRRAEARPTVLTIALLGLTSALLFALARLEIGLSEIASGANYATREWHQTFAIFVGALGWLAFVGTLGLIVVRVAREIKS